MSIWTAARIDVVTAARAPADLLVAGPVLLGGRPARCQSSCEASRMAVSSSPAVNGRALHLVDGRWRRPGTRLARCAQSCPDVHLGDEHRRVAAQHVTEVRRERVEVHEVDVGDLRCRRARRAARRRRSPPTSSPSRGRARRRRRSPWTSIGGMSVGDAGDLRGAEVHHPLVVVGRVGDVARPVLLLDAADAVHEARRARDRPRASERLGIAEVRPEHLGCRRRRTWFGSVGERHGDVGQRRRRRGAATARNRSRGSRRTAGSPACGT